MELQKVPKCLKLNSTICVTLLTESRTGVTVMTAVEVDLSPGGGAFGSALSSSSSFTSILTFPSLASLFASISFSKHTQTKKKISSKVCHVTVVWIRLEKEE